MHKSIFRDFGVGLLTLLMGISFLHVIYTIFCGIFGLTRFYGG